MAAKSVTDKEKVAAEHLNTMFGLPAKSLTLQNDLVPTVPLFYLRQCDHGSRHALTLPVDMQARLSAILVIINESQYKVFRHDWTRGFNPIGVRFGDVNFSNLPSFRKR